MLLMGVAEGQNSLSSREWRNAGKVSLGALTGTWVCCLLLLQRTLPQLEGSASLVADSLPELSWHSHSSPPLSPWAKRKRVTEKQLCTNAEAQGLGFLRRGQNGPKRRENTKEKGGVPTIDGSTRAISLAVPW